MISNLDYAPGIPKYIVRVEDITNQPAENDNHARVSVHILFCGAAREYERKYKPDTSMGWSFINFDPDPQAKNRSLENSVEWLDDYAHRHSVLPDPVIFCDFDKHINHFKSQVDFRIGDIANGRLDFSKLPRYAKYGFTINFGHIGDIFHNIDNSQIINRSQLSH